MKTDISKYVAWLSDEVYDYQVGWLYEFSGKLGGQVNELFGCFYSGENLFFVSCEDQLF